MNVRDLKPSDVPILQAMAKDSGFPCPDFDSPNIETIRVVVDEDDQPFMAAMGERILQFYLFVGRAESEPFRKLRALRMLHDELTRELKARGFSEANGFIAPSLARQFGRRLERSFGWVKNWPSWCKRF